MSYTPQYINDKEIEGTPLTADLKVLKEEIAKNVNYDYSRVVLRAVTSETVLVSALTNSGANDCIYDLSSKKCTFISNEGGVNSVKIGETIVYIDNQELSYYKLGQDVFVTFPNSELTAPETYLTGESDMLPTINETHTNSSITVSVYDRNQFVGTPGTSDFKGFKKLREIQFNVQ